MLARAKQRLEAQRDQHEQRRARRLEEIYRKCPRIAALDREIKGTVIDAVGLALKSGQDPSDAMAELRDKNLDLQSERIRALLAAGFSPEDIDGEYLCTACRDTGYVGTEPCQCLMKLYREELKASLSSLLKLGDETFDTFDLTWYDDTYDPRLGTSPRRHMEAVVEACYRYANKFSEKSSNLFLSGDPGLGKTFLSACIARVVADKGYSVVYDMACAIFATFEEEKFSKSDDLTALRSEIRRYLACDLLIVDDLGTEMTTAFTVAALYELINTRLIAGKKTVISSNLSTDELHRRYTPQIMSRLLGEYQVLKFYGSDIRLLKKGI
jgi:DNA replication protein DnaC